MNTTTNSTDESQRDDAVWCENGKSCEKKSHKKKRKEEEKILRAQNETLDLTTEVYSELSDRRRWDSRVNPFSLCVFLLHFSVAVLAIYLRYSSYINRPTAYGGVYGAR